MSPLRIVVAFAFAAAIAAPASAARRDIGPTLDRTYLQFYQNTLVVERFASCLVERVPEEAKELFAQSPDQTARETRLNELARSQGVCLRAERLHIEPIVLLGAVAEALYEANPGVAPDPAADATDKPGGGNILWTWKKLDDVNRQRNLEVAECVTRRAPSTTARLMTVTATSKEERNSFIAMSDQLSSCIPTGDTVMFQPMILRGALAQALYLATGGRRTTQEAAE